MSTIVSNTIIITTGKSDYCITKAYLSSNSTNNTINLSYSIGPYTNGFYNAAITMFDGINTTTDYVTLEGYLESDNIWPNIGLYYYLMI